MRGDLHVAIGERGNELRSPKLVSAGGVIEERIQIARLPALRVEGVLSKYPSAGCVSGSRAQAGSNAPRVRARHATFGGSKRYSLPSFGSFQSTFPEPSALEKSST